MIDLPRPKPGHADRLSPTAANDLLICAYKLAWRLDPRTKSLRRPTPWSKLGGVAHALVEDVAKGLLRDVESRDEARELVEKAWDQHIASAMEDLAATWNPALPPPPDEWPGYHLTRARTIRRALRRFDARPEARPGIVQVEETIEDPSTGLWGRPDRVEGAPGDRRVVDLKTGLTQEGATSSQRRQLLLYAHLVAKSTGDMPRGIAIEDASGRRWEESVTEEDIQAAIDEVQLARAEYDQLIEQDDLLALANPSADNCRSCPYRPVCGPYWEALQTTWQHGSVAGIVRKVKAASAGSVIEIDAISPCDATGSVWVVSAVPERDARAGTQISILNAELTGVAQHLRWKWSTMSQSFGSL